MLFRELEILSCMNLAVRVTYCSYSTRHRGLEEKHLMLMLHALILVRFAIRICRRCRKTETGGASVLYAYRASLSEIPVCLAGTARELNSKIAFYRPLIQIPMGSWRHERRTTEFVKAPRFLFTFGLCIARPISSWRL
jgi:hypothetical protein